jgi:hypothetical protein
LASFGQKKRKGNEKIPEFIRRPEFKHITIPQQM